MKTIKLGTLVFSLLLAALTLANSDLYAQNDEGRGLFCKGNAYEKEEDIERGVMGLFSYSGEGFNLFNQQFGDEEGGFNLVNQTFGQEEVDVPLGSGLLVLLAASVGYALGKRKSENK